MRNLPDRTEALVVGNFVHTSAVVLALVADAVIDVDLATCARKALGALAHETTGFLHHTSAIIEAGLSIARVDCILASERFEVANVTRSMLNLWP